MNLAPADLQKEACHFDLPIAPGELSLDGRVSPVAGVVPAAIHALSCGLGLICPAAQGGEAA